MVGLDYNLIQFNLKTLNLKLGWLTEWDGLDGWAGNICQSAQTSRLNSFLSVNFTFEKHFRNIGETFEKQVETLNYYLLISRRPTTL